MKKAFNFLGGLPRAGSTLLCNVLAQNPRFHTTATSGIMDVMFGVRNQWSNLLEFKANPNEPAKLKVLRGILESFYADVEKPVIFDKCRGWISLLEMAEAVLGTKAKVIVPVRNIADVLASFEKLHRQTAATRQPGGESAHYFQMQTVEGRCEFWTRNDQPVGLAFNRIKDAIQRGFRDRMCFVDYDELTGDPYKTMKSTYRFLGEDYFDHDFDNVEQVTWENDEVHGIKNLHTIRPKIERTESSALEVLGPIAVKYTQWNCWKSLFKE